MLRPIDQRTHGRTQVSTSNASRSLGVLVDIFLWSAIIRVHALFFVRSTSDKEPHETKRLEKVEEDDLRAASLHFEEAS